MEKKEFELEEMRIPTGQPYQTGVHRNIRRHTQCEIVNNSIIQKRIYVIDGKKFYVNSIFDKEGLPSAADGIKQIIHRNMEKYNRPSNLSGL